VELRISRIEAKAKLSQNRPAADIDGVVEGTRSRGDLAMSRAVDEARPVVR
jgi:transcriptional regulator